MMGNTGLVTGTNNAVPQVILQGDHQVKYDGTKSWRQQIFRYGFTINRIVAAADAPIGSLAPYVSTNVGLSEMSFAASGPFTCAATNGTTVSGASCPLNYPVEIVSVTTASGTSRRSLARTTRRQRLVQPGGHLFWGSFKNKKEFNFECWRSVCARARP